MLRAVVAFVLIVGGCYVAAQPGTQRWVLDTADAYVPTIGGAIGAGLQLLRLRDALPPDLGPPPEPVVEVPFEWIGERPADPYEGIRYDLDVQRRVLAEWTEEGEDTQVAARGLITNYLPHLMRSWQGTAYSYSGTTEVPGQGKIACGYYVSTVLQHAGFEVDRVELARQPSEQILRTVVPDHEIDRFSWASRKKVVDHVRAQGPGIYIVGLDTHVGFLVFEGDDVTFCHATRRKRKGVVCEDAVTSPSLKSRYTVVGPLGHDAMLDAWLSGEVLPTAFKGEPQELFAPAQQASAG